MNGSLEGLSEEIVAREGTVPFEYFASFVLFCIMRGCVLIQRKITKCAWGKSGACGGNIELMAVSEIYNVRHCLFFI
jgi:hypothetical protein